MSDCPEPLPEFLHPFQEVIKRQGLSKDEMALHLGIIAAPVLQFLCRREKVDFIRCMPPVVHVLEVIVKPSMLHNGVV